MEFFKSLRTRRTKDKEIIKQILSIEPRTETSVTDALTNLTDTDLNLIIEEVYRKQLAKRPSTQAEMTEALWYANEARDRMIGDQINPYAPNADISRKLAIQNLTTYFVKAYYNMNYDEQRQMKKGGKLYRSKKHKKNKKCKSKRCHKKNIRKTRRRM